MTRLLTGLALLAAFALPAQTITPKKILFTGAPQFAPADLLATTGLDPGPITSDDMRAGAKKLADSGFFSNVGFSYDNVALTYKLTPAPAASLMPVHYENLLWWTPQELTAELHRRHPLFTTLLPQNGTLQDQLVADMVAMLADKGVTATIIPTVSPNGGNFMFVLGSPNVSVHALQINGLDPALTARMEDMRLSFTGKDFSDVDTPPILKRALKEAVQDEGYLDVVVDSYQCSAPVLVNGVVNVDLSISAHPGDRYTITAVNWPGSPLLSASDFAKVASLKIGQPPSLRAWHGTEYALAAIYSSRGYMAAKTNVTPQLDHAAHIVSYDVTVTPGPQYAFRTLTLTGVNDKQRQEFMKAWKIQPGMAYDGTYVYNFLQMNAASLRSLDGDSLAYKQTIDDNLLKVDLQIEIKQGDKVH